MPLLFILVFHSQVTILYVGTFIAGIVGNVIVCMVIIRHSSMHTATNYYLFSLAVSDLIYLLFGEYGLGPGQGPFVYILTIEHSDTTWKMSCLPIISASVSQKGRKMGIAIGKMDIKLWAKLPTDNRKMVEKRWLNEARRKP